MKYKIQKTKYYNKNNPHFKGGKSKCKICNKLLSGYDHIYCSKHIPHHRMSIDTKTKIGKSNKGDKNGAYKTGFYCNDKKCIDCKKYCSSGAIRCKSCNEHLNKLGKKNPQFIHGKSHLPYTKNFLKIRLLIMKRDNYICQLCNKYGKTVHHIDYNKQNDKENNLITLCKKCNTKVNTNRDYWYAYFTYKQEK